VNGKATATILACSASAEEVLQALLEGMTDLRVLADKGLRSRAVSAELARHHILLLTPPTKAERASMSAAVQRFIADHRNRIEGSYTTLKDQLHLEHHRAHTGWGLITRLVTKFAAYTLRAVWRRAGLAVE